MLGANLRFAATKIQGAAQSPLEIHQCPESVPA
jgi:hypothetical protein